MKLRVVLGTPKFATGVRSEDGLRTVPSRTVCVWTKGVEVEMEASRSLQKMFKKEYW